MDASSLADLVNVLSKGGPIVMIAVAWILFRAGRVAQEAAKTATDAVTTLKEIRDAVSDSKKTMDAMATSIRAIEENVLEIDERSKATDAKLNEFLARRPAATG